MSVLNLLVKKKKMVLSNFLDLTIFKNNCNFKFKHYKKSTYTGRIINFFSNQPKHFKINTAKSLLRNWIKLSDFSFHKEIESEFRIILERNNYPTNFINSIINSYSIQHTPPANPPHQRVSYFSIPFIGTPSVMIKKYLESLNSSTKVTFSGYNCNVKYFSKVKDKVPLGKLSGLVYSVPCNNCDNSYVGETVQWLESRLNQHKRDVENQRNNTALCEHTSETGHSFNFSKTSVLCFETNEKKRKMRECIEIMKRNTVNFKTDVNGISCTYLPVIDKTRHRRTHVQPCSSDSDK